MQQAKLKGFARVLKIFLDEYEPQLLDRQGQFTDDYLAHFIMPRYGVSRKPSEIGVSPDKLKGYEARFIDVHDVR